MPPPVRISCKPRSPHITLPGLADRSHQARSAEEACEIAGAELTRNG
jgi:hypothetical protein